MIMSTSKENQLKAKNKSNSKNRKVAILQIATNFLLNNAYKTSVVSFYVLLLRFSNF